MTGWSGELNGDGVLLISVIPTGIYPPETPMQKAAANVIFRLLRLSLFLFFPFLHVPPDPAVDEGYCYDDDGEAQGVGAHVYDVVAEYNFQCH